MRDRAILAAGRLRPLSKVSTVNVEGPCQSGFGNVPNRDRSRPIDFPSRATVRRDIEVASALCPRLPSTRSPQPAQFRFYAFFTSRDWLVVPVIKFLRFRRGSKKPLTKLFTTSLVILVGRWGLRLMCWREIHGKPPSIATAVCMMYDSACMMNDDHTTPRLRMFADPSPPELDLQNK